jgi:hypothetical protein
VPAAKTTTIHFCIKYCYPGSGSAVAISAPHNLCPAFGQHRRDRRTAYVLQKCARIDCIPRHITARLLKRAYCIELFAVLASSPRRAVSAAFYNSDRSTYAASFSFGRQDSACPGIFGYTGPKGWLQSLFAPVAVDNALGAEHALPTTVCLATPYHVAAKPSVPGNIGCRIGPPNRLRIVRPAGGSPAELVPVICFANVDRVCCNHTDLHAALDAATLLFSALRLARITLNDCIGIAVTCVPRSRRAILD